MSDGTQQSDAGVRFIPLFEDTRPSDTDGLVSRLRATAGAVVREGWVGEDRLYDEAADTIEAQAAKIAELEGALEQAKKPRFGEPGYVAPALPTHPYKPHPKYGTWCEECGYPEHERLKHPPRQALGPRE